MLDMNDVALFVQVVESGSFAAAGRHLNIPANTISRRIAQLEAALATRLLQRSTRKLGLTSGGLAFFEQCRHGMGYIDQACASLRQLNQSLGGIIRVAAPMDFFDHVPMAIMESFMQRYPETRLVFSLDDQRVDLIAQGIDVAFRAGNLTEAMYAARKLGPSRLILAASREYQQQYGLPTRLADLAQHACVVRSDREPEARWTLHGPHGAESVKVSGRFASNGMQSLLRAVRAGFGIGLLPGMLIASELDAQHLIHVLPDYAIELGGVYAVYPSRHHRLPAAVALVDFIVNALNIG